LPLLCFGRVLKQAFLDGSTGGKREAYADITRGFGSGSENENSSKRFIESEERRKEPSMISAIRSVVKS